MARRPLGNPSRVNRPVESVTTNLWTSGAEIITPAMGRPLKPEMAAPRIWALVSGSACAFMDEAKIAAVTIGKAIMTPYYTTPADAFPSLHTPFSFIAHISPTRCLPPHRVTHDQREVAGVVGTRRSTFLIVPWTSR